MTRSASAHISQKRLGDLLHVRVSGTVDETFGTLQLSLDRETIWVLDLAHIDRVTSWGVQHWLKFIDEAARLARPVLIARAPPCIVDQLNMVEGFQGGAQVLSVLAPYVCKPCDHRQLRPIVLNQHLESIRSAQAPKLSCPTCSSALEFEDFPVHFFAFAGLQTQSPIPPEAALFNEWLCGPESTVEVEARFLTHVSGATLYVVDTTPPHPLPRPPLGIFPLQGLVTEVRKDAPPTVLRAYLGDASALSTATRAAVIGAGYRQVAREEDANVIFGGLDPALGQPLSTQDSGGPRIHLFNGVLEPHFAASLKTPGPLLLLGCRGPEAAPSAWELRLLNRLLRKVELLPPGCSESTYDVSSMDAIRSVSEAAGELASTGGKGAGAREIAIDVAYELMTNALLDAPVDAHGGAKYAFRRDQVSEVDPGDECRCTLSMDDGLLFIRVVDRFGRLTKSHVANALEKSGPKRIEIDMSGGGAGLGLRRVLTGSDAAVFSVTPSRRTEVCAVIRLTETARRRDRLPKSLFVDAPL